MTLLVVRAQQVLTLSQMKVIDYSFSRYKQALGFLVVSAKIL